MAEINYHLVGDFARGGYTGSNTTGNTPGIFIANKEKTVTYLDAYEGDGKRAAAIRVIEDGIKNRAFAQKAYTNLDFNEAVSYLLLELIIKNDK